MDNSLQDLARREAPLEEVTTHAEKNGPFLGHCGSRGRWAPMVAFAPRKDQSWLKV
jgi:hypothetical protein